MYYNRLPWNERLRKERQGRFWTQEELAEMLGADPRTVRRWEHGHGKPSYLHIRGLSKIFDKTPTQLGFMNEEDNDV
jgi:transcriptional regulator with XRE-family HTH domain